ncbi:hypothetical protein HDU67_009370 [Dinochytrium kinnereticum]|nr:hypothetical protein HDU67_009370 [Dinochytrium kinnereticum]
MDPRTANADGQPPGDASTIPASASTTSSTADTPATPAPSTSRQTATPITSSFPSHIATTAATNITAYATALGSSISDALASAVSEQLRLPKKHTRRKTSNSALDPAVEPTVQRSGLPGMPAGSLEDGVVTADLPPLLPPREPASGIVTVVEASVGNEDEKGLNFLTKIPRFEPLIKASVDTNFNWGGIFSANYSTKRRDAPHTLDPVPFENILRRIRRHSKTCIDAVLIDQKLLTERVNSMDEYCAKLANTISGRGYQARVNADALAKLLNITKQAEMTKSLLVGIASSLDKLDAFLAPGERLDNLENKQRYPAIVKMRSKLSPNFFVVSPTSPSFEGFPR